MKFKIIKVSFWKYVYILAFAKTQPFVGVWREKQYSQESDDISDLVISKDVSLKIFNKKEPKSVLTKFHDFVIGLLLFFH